MKSDKNNRIPENDPSKAMDSRKEVAKSNDEKTDQDFPGYPHYPAKEDIMDQRTDNHRVDVGVEKFAAGPNASGINERFVANEQKNAGDETGSNTSGVGATHDELAALNGRNEEIGTPHNISNDDLKSGNVPGTDLNESQKNP